MRQEQSKASDGRLLGLELLLGALRAEAAEIQARSGAGGGVWLGSSLFREEACQTDLISAVDFFEFVLGFKAQALIVEKTIGMPDSYEVAIRFLDLSLGSGRRNSENLIRLCQLIHEHRLNVRATKGNGKPRRMGTIKRKFRIKKGENYN